MKTVYKTKGTCSSQIEIETENGIITDVSFKDGCAGNLAGISTLVKGMKVDEAIAKLKGITCGRRKTSCPDQLAVALENL